LENQNSPLIGVLSIVLTVTLIVVAAVFLRYDPVDMGNQTSLESEALPRPSQANVIRDTTPSGALAARDTCRDARSPYDWRGTQSVTYNLACVDTTFGSCPSGWQVIMYDGAGCAVPSDPGVGTLTVDVNTNGGSSFIRTGLRCGAWDYRNWPHVCSVPQCVKAYTADGVNRLANGLVHDGPGGPLPTFPAGGTGVPVSCL